MESRTPDFAEWLAQVESGLGGRSWQDVGWKTADVDPIPALVRRADADRLPHRRVEALLKTRRGFAIRELVKTADPRAAVTRAKGALARGADEIEFCLDALAHDAISPGGSIDDGPDADLLATPPPGEGGVAVHTHRDLELLLEGVDLATTSLWFSAGEGALAVLAWWLRHARTRRVAFDALRGGLDIDPIEQILSRRLRSDEGGQCHSARTSPDSVFDAAAGVVMWTRKHAPGIRPLVFDAQSFHLAGATPVYEIAFLLGAIAEVARGLASRGVGFADIAAASTIRVQVDHEFVSEIAKLRALRLTYAKLAHAFGAEGDGLVPRILALTSSRSRAELYDHRTNLIRSSIAATAAVLGGCDSLIVMPFDGSDDERARDLALDQQNLLRFEARLERMVDPTGGSSAIEVMTDGIAHRAWDQLRALESERGLLWAARLGLLPQILRERGRMRAGEFGTGSRTLVGINRYVDPELGAPEEREIDLDAMDDFADSALARFENFLRRRDEKKAKAHAMAMRRAKPADLLATTVGDGANEVTLEELVTATWPRPGTDFTHFHDPVAAADGFAFEELRALVDTLRDSGEPVPDVRLIRVGSSPTSGARADFARDLLNAVGLQPTTSICDDLAAARAWAKQVEPDAVVLCADDAGAPALTEAMRKAFGVDTTLVWVGEPTAAVGQSFDLAIHRGADLARSMEELHRRLGIVLDLDEGVETDEFDDLDDFDFPPGTRF